MARRNFLSTVQRNADRPAAVDEDFTRLDSATHHPTVPLNIGDQRAGQLGRAAAAHLSLGRARQQHRDMVAKPTDPGIDFAQAVEEQQAGLYRWVLEFLPNEFERRERGYL